MSTQVSATYDHASEQEPDLAELKRRADVLLARFEAEVGDPAVPQYIITASQLRHAAADIARAAHCEEVRAAVEQRDTRKRRQLRLLRATQVIAGIAGAGGAAAAVIGAAIGS